MIRFDENIGLVAFDFDDTLFIHPRHNYSKEEDLLLFSRILAGDSDVYPKERFSPTLLAFMEFCRGEGIPIALCSRCAISAEADYKINLIQGMVGTDILNLCVGSNEMKPVVLDAYAKANRIKPENIIFIDDLWDNLASVEKLGMQAASPAEVIMYMSTKMSPPRFKESLKPPVKSILDGA